MASLITIELKKNFSIVGALLTIQHFECLKQEAVSPTW